MRVPIDNLSEAALRKIIEEFILREGTDYGAVEYSLDLKVGQVLKQLQRGDAALVFDDQTETIDIVTGKKALENE